MDNMDNMDNVMDNILSTFAGCKFARKTFCPK
jgi:hypothetical protein